MLLKRQRVQISAITGTNLWFNSCAKTCISLVGKWLKQQKTTKCIIYYVKYLQRKRPKKCLVVPLRIEQAVIFKISCNASTVYNAIYEEDFMSFCVPIQDHGYRSRRLLHGTQHRFLVPLFLDAIFLFYFCKFYKNNLFTIIEATQDSNAGETMIDGSWPVGSKSFLLNSLGICYHFLF